MLSGRFILDSVEWMCEGSLSIMILVVLSSDPHSCHISILRCTACARHILTMSRDCAIVVLPCRLHGSGAPTVPMTLFKELGVMPLMTAFHAMTHHQVGAELTEIQRA